MLMSFTGALLRVAMTRRGTAVPFGGATDGVTQSNGLK